MTLYLSDLDGTLLNQQGQLSAYSCKILREFLAKGYAFSIATGRTPLSALALLDQIPIKLPMILLNGALIMTADGAITDAFPLNPEEIRLLQRQEHDSGLSRLQIGLQGNHVVCSIPKDPLWTDFFSRNQNGHLRFPKVDFASGETDCLYSIFLDNRPDRLVQIVKNLERYALFTLDFYKDRYCENLWGLEIYPKRITKGRALKSLIEQTGYTDCVCFADGLNDLSMVEYCSKLVAVSNSCPELLKAADECTGSNEEEGVALWLQSHVLQRTTSKLSGA